jgi:alpha-tubulin suppressor-like RCC1 family protein
MYRVPVISAVLFSALAIFCASTKGRAETLPSVINNQVLGAGENLAKTTAFSAILQKDGTVWTVGANGSDQLGDGYTGGYTTVPVQVVNLNNITAISIGPSYGLALKSDGTVWAWGNSSTGQLGSSVGSETNVAVQVPGLPTIRSISAGGAHCLAIGADGTVWAWGGNASGQLGSSGGNSSTPAQIAGLSNIIEVAAGSSHSLALTAAGTVYAFGNNNSWQLGRSTVGGPTPTLISGLTHVISVSAYTQSAALCSDGTGYVWGVSLGYVPLQIGLLHIKLLTEGACANAIDSLGNLYTMESFQPAFYCNTSGVRASGIGEYPMQMRSSRRIGGHPDCGG